EDGGRAGAAARRQRARRRREQAGAKRVVAPGAPQDLAGRINRRSWDHIKPSTAVSGPFQRNGPLYVSTGRSTSMSLADSGMAIGAVTRLLQDHLLRRSFVVSIGKPEDAADTDTAAPKLNLFLYETTFDAQLRNVQLRDGEPPPLWLVLKYLLTAFDGDKGSDTPGAHDLLGRGMAALHELNFLRLDPSVDSNVRLALENNPEPLKLTFDETNHDLLAKIMQGTDERYRLSVAFQLRPVMIVPASLPRSSLLV